MAESNEPKKETVRISLPPRRTPSPSSQNGDTARLNVSPPSGVEAPKTLSALMPAPGSVPAPPPPRAKIPVPPPPAAEVSAPRILPPPPPKPASIPIPPPPAPIPRPPVADTTLISPLTAQPKTESVTPKTETARITLPPEPPKPPVKMTKTQPLVAAPAAPRVPLTTPVIIAPARTELIVEAIPLSLCWGLVAISAATLLIAIWTYIS